MFSFSSFLEFSDVSLTVVVYGFSHDISCVFSISLYIYIGVFLLMSEGLIMYVFRSGGGGAMNSRV